jgi:citrate lyase subunit beta/citryl-CoA lyase
MQRDASNPVQTARALLAAAADRLPHATDIAAADVLLLELGSGTSGNNLAAARRATPSLFVRTRPLPSPDIDADLDLAVGAGADGFVLTGDLAPGGIEHLGAKLAVWEAEHGRPDGETRILAVVDSAAAALAIMQTREPGARLAGLVAEPPRDSPGAAARLRAATLLVADAWGIPAFLAVPEPTAASLFAAVCRRARHDGFAGLVTPDPRTLPTIRATFAR